MKEKNKKVIKGLCVGVLACTAIFGLTGCSGGVKISQEEYDRLVAGVQKVEDGVVISQEEYDRLVAGVEQVENAVSNEEAAYVFSKAKMKIIDTESDFWNNMYAKSIYEEYDSENKLEYSFVEETYSLKHEDNYIFMQKTIGEVDTYNANKYHVIYTDYTQTGKNLTIFRKYDDGEIYKTTEVNYRYFDACIEGGMLADFGLGNGEGVNFEFYPTSYVAGGRINEAGNYVITLILDAWGIETTSSFTETSKIEYEIDANFNLLSITVKDEWLDMGERANAVMKINFSYGKISYANISNEMNIISQVPEST